MQIVQTKFFQFFIKFNVVYLGLLFLCFVFTAAVSSRVHIEFGGPLYWEYGYQLIGVVLLLYLIAIPSWVFAIVRTWKLSKSGLGSHKWRLIAISYLTLTPAVLALLGQYWVKAARFITDPLFF